MKREPNGGENHRINIIIGSQLDFEYSAFLASEQVKEFLRELGKKIRKEIIDEQQINQ